MHVLVLIPKSSQIYTLISSYDDYDDYFSLNQDQIFTHYKID